MKFLLLSVVLGLLYAGHGEAQLLLKPVPGVVQAGRRSWGICVCVSLLGFGHVDLSVWPSPCNSKLLYSLALYVFCMASVSSLLSVHWLSCLFTALVKQKISRLVD